MIKTTFGVFLLWGIVFLACDRPVEKRNVVATVGTESLTLDEVLEEIPLAIRSKLTQTEIREYVLRWINSQVLYQEALAQNLDERRDFHKEFEKLKRELLINKLVERALNEDVSVPEEEITSYYEANKDGFILTEDVVHAYHILFPTRKEASQVSQRLKAGESFAAVFTDVKLDSTNGSLDDWDLGYFSRDEIAPEISNVVFNLRKGATSLPIKSSFGYHVVQVVDKQSKGEVKSFDLVKDEIRFKLEAKRKQDKYQRFLLQMKSKHPYQTNFHLLDSSLDSLLEKGVASQ